jgi:hypothetical protein
MNVAVPLKLNQLIDNLLHLGRDRVDALGALSRFLLVGGSHCLTFH